MLNDYEAFEKAYGREVPAALKALYDDRELLASTPLRITLPGKPFVVEIQDFQKVSKVVAEEVKCQRFTFAVNSDGFDMLVDLNERDLPVWQREYGDVDSLDFTLVEFLAAARLKSPEPLPPKHDAKQCVAPDCGSITAFQGSMSHLPPQQVN